MHDFSHCQTDTSQHAALLTLAKSIANGWGQLDGEPWDAGLVQD